ncbi:DEAD/DEAH box helicase family protein [Clostridium neuense]|uniref:DEAD/DEAH box helicase family protein n=1 Tax=Clostridium neuense TaxID=1728934 RepID=A0ABW8TD57_9CLOT
MELKVELINEPYNFIEDSIVTEKKLISKYVSDGIGEDYLYWKSQNPVLISAQTGMGKNTFIETIIIKHCVENNKKILIISNRTANNRQQKKRVSSIVGCEYILENFTPKGLDELETFKNVRIVTYQKLEKYLYNYCESKKLEKFDFVVFDECHYFESDSLFNNGTGKTLYKSLSVFKNSIRIFMTATPDEIFKIIIQKEKALGLSSINKIYYINHPIESFFYPKTVLYYNFQRNYNYISPKYFNNKDTLLELIKNDNSNFKWLIFVTNKQDGENFVNNIGKNSTFITSESKNSKYEDGKIYSQVVTTEKFTCKVLVSTSVMDNGINFKDPLLKNIVIFAYDKTEFIQMLGRKRVINDESINLYLYGNNVKTIRNKLSGINKQIEAICLLKDNPSLFLNQYFRNSELISGLIYFNKNLEPKINEFAEKKLYFLKNFYENLISNFILIGKQAFILEQLAWLSLEKTYNPKLWIDYIDSDKNKRKLIEFLNSNCNIPLSDKALENFQINFKELFVATYGKQSGDRSDRVYKETKMRKLLEKYDLPYKITIKNNAFTLCKM